MKKIVLITLVWAVTLSLAFIAGGSFAPQRRPAPKEEKEELWTCGMHPQVIRDKTGRCPICQMELTPLRGTPPKAKGPEVGAGGAAVISIDPVMEQNMGVRVARVEKGRLATRVRA